MQVLCPYCMNTTEAERPCPHCGRVPASYVPAKHHLPPGTFLKERYMVAQVLGEGGFGITYLGWDASLERRVAVKEFFPRALVQREASATLDVSCLTVSSQDFFNKERAGFLQEARTMARLDKVPEIVHVLDFFSENETAYIVMEFLEGKTLRQLTKGGPIPTRILLEMMEPVLRAMEKMHRAGLIHRDISPDNLMQMRDGTVKLMDFGCARDIDGGATMTVMLKHGYAPVEQYAGHDQGPWTDVYALCATLYYCLTKRVPPRALTRLGEGQDQLPPPNRLGAALTPQQEQALLKGLAVQPQDRWQRVADLYMALYGKAVENDARQTGGYAYGAVAPVYSSEPRISVSGGATHPAVSGTPAIPPGKKKKKETNLLVVALGVVGALLAGVLAFGILRQSWQKSRPTSPEIPSAMPTDATEQPSPIRLVDNTGETAPEPEPAPSDQPELNISLLDLGVHSVELSRNSLILETGGMATLTATVKPFNIAGKAVSWSTSDPEVIRVSGSGTVTAVGPGTATVTASCGTHSDICTVTVN